LTSINLRWRIVPKTWPELLEILALQKQRWTLCLDEFPYLTAVDPSLPSQLQKWVDHSLPERRLLVLAGSSTRMMHDLFLHRAASLYGRAAKLLHVRPMEFPAFCSACGLHPAESESFEKFSCVGGIPKYWEFVEAEAFWATSAGASFQPRSSSWLKGTPTKKCYRAKDEALCPVDYQPNTRRICRRPDSSVRRR
jgi:hypothetical protein